MITSLYPWRELRTWTGWDGRRMTLEVCPLRSRTLVSSLLLLLLLLRLRTIAVRTGALCSALLWSPTWASVRLGAVAHASKSVSFRQWTDSLVSVHASSLLESRVHRGGEEVKSVVAPLLCPAHTSSLVSPSLSRKAQFIFRNAATCFSNVTPLSRWCCTMAC